MVIDKIIFIYISFFEKKKRAWLPYILQWTRWKFSIFKTGSTDGCLPLGWILVHVRWTKMFIFASLWCSPLTLLGGKLQTWVAPIKIQPSMLGRFLQLRGRIWPRCRIWPRGDASLTVWRVYKMRLRESVIILLICTQDLKCRSLSSSLIEENDFKPNRYMLRYELFMLWMVIFCLLCEW